jgi:hypothetical protein
MPLTHMPCDGCSRLTFVAGPLTPCTVTYKNGARSLANYCGQCLSAVTEAPEWVRANTDLASIERVPESRLRENTMLAEQYAVQRPAGIESLTDDSIVELEGERVRWGDLMLADRKAYLAGGYFI